MTGWQGRVAAISLALLVGSIGYAAQTGAFVTPWFWLVFVIANLPVRGVGLCPPITSRIRSRGTSDPMKALGLGTGGIEPGG